MFDLNFYQDENKWKQNLIPIESSKNISEKVFDLLLYKNHYVLIEKLRIILSIHDSKIEFSSCLCPFLRQNV